MEYILYICKFLYRIRWWLILGTIAITILAIIGTKHLGKKYFVECSVYTGVISGYSIEGDGNKDYAMAQNAIDNLINIIKSEGTLQNVCLRLYARCLINGNPDKDNNFILAGNYKMIFNHLKNSPNGKYIISLIDKKNENLTYQRFKAVYDSSKDNYLYGLFHYNMPHFCFQDLQKVTVEREGNSDLLHLTYTDSDPGIAYNTLLILSTEFVNEYRSIRYGETDKVIDYFKTQLELIGGELHGQEDDLTSYNVSKRIINYGDETKEIAAINKEYEIRYQDALLLYNSSKSALKELERQMSSNAKQYTTNIEFLNKLKQVSDLQAKVSEGEILPNSDESSLQTYKNKLDKAQRDLSSITNKYQKHQYTKEGIETDNITGSWLTELISNEKSKADLNVINKARENLNEKYIFFAPVGSTIKRKERNINFTEANYLSLLKSYDDALMRKKNLEMTSATLKVLNPPSYPLTPLGGARKKIVMGACAGSFLFILGFFLLLELLDQTLRDSIRTRRLTKSKVLGAFPSHSIFQYRNYNNICTEIATKYLSGSVLRFFTQQKEGMPYIVNFISTEDNAGKTYLIEQLLQYWENIGLKGKVITEGKEYIADSKNYLMAKNIKDFYLPSDENILIIEHPSLNNSSVPTNVLKQANLNLLIVRADRGWKSSDRTLLNNLKEQIGDTTLYVYLNQASRSEVQNYTGMLPPYTLLRRLMYRYSQLSFTERSSKSFKKSPVINKEEDDNDEE